MKNQRSFTRPNKFYFIQNQVPKQRFFSALSKSKYLSQFMDLIYVEINRAPKVNEWDIAHCFFALIYALKTTQVYNFDILQAREKQWNVVLKGLFTNNSILEVFKKGMEMYMQSMNVFLTIPVRLLLNRLFQKRKKLKGYDFGCGLHIDLPILASDYLWPNYCFPPTKIQDYNYPVPISQGIGIDCNPANLEWVKTCTSALALTKEQANVIDRELDCLVNLRADNLEKFPSFQVNIFKFTPRILADFVLTKKMRYQHGEDKQILIKELINVSLKNGGYWITVAEENYFTDGHTKYFEKTNDEIWVYQKQNDKLILLCDHPLIKVSRCSGEISYYDAAFFGTKI